MDENTIVELDKVEEDTLYGQTVTEVKDDEIIVSKEPKKRKKSKNKKEFFYKNLSKKGKIIFWVIIGIVILAIIGVGLYFILPKNKEPEEKVFIEKDNYIYEDGVLKFLDEKDKVLGTYECIKKDDKKCYVAKLSNEDDFDIDKYVDLDDLLIEANSSIYRNKYVFVFDDGKITLYDISKKQSFGEYKLIKTGQNTKDFIAYKNTDNKYGIIKFTDNGYDEIIKDQQYVGIINSFEKFVGKTSDESYLIDANGEKLTSNIKGEIKKFTDKLISVKTSDGYKIYNYKGNALAEETYDFVDFYEDYILTVTDSKLFVCDENATKLNMTPIRLKSKDYNKKIVFDEKNNIKETKSAYKVLVENNLITITLSDNSVKTIDLKEIALNKQYDYVSYSDGILYFYSDEDKKELLGKYNCVNSNEKGLDNCFIAKESSLFNKDNNGYSPIINGTFVFINDTKTGANNNTIVLYNLIKNERVTTYYQIDTGVASEDITTASLVNTLVMAQSTDGSYGIVTFSNDGPSLVIPFRVTSDDKTYKTTSITEFKTDYLLVKRENKYYLYDKNGNQVFSSNYEISDYFDPYVIVKDKGYILYEKSSEETGRIVSNELEYIKIYDDFFAGIKDNKINLYKYSDGKTKILEKDVNLIVKDEKYNNFKISIDSNYYIVDVKDNDNKYLSYKFDNSGKEVKNEEE